MVEKEQTQKIVPFSVFKTFCQILNFCKTCYLKVFYLLDQSKICTKQKNAFCIYFFYNLGTSDNQERFPHISAQINKIERF